MGRISQILKFFSGSTSHITTFIISLTVAFASMYIAADFYDEGPFAPIGAQVSYKVGDPMSQPNGSFLLPITIWNSGSEDIGSFRFLYYFESYINGISDREFSILDRFPNASPYIATDKDIIYREDNNRMTIPYSSLPKNEKLVEQLYINKIYPVKVIQKTQGIKLKQETDLHVA